MLVNAPGLPGRQGWAASCLYCPWTGPVWLRGPGADGEPLRSATLDARVHMACPAVPDRVPQAWPPDPPLDIVPGPLPRPAPPAPAEGDAAEGDAAAEGMAWWLLNAKPCLACGTTMRECSSPTLPICCDHCAHPRGDTR